MKKSEVYTLDASYLDAEFSSIDEVVEYATLNGVDPSLTILKNGKRTGERVIDYIVF